MGRASAIELAHRGFAVLAGVRNEQAAMQLRRDGIEPVVLDITRASDIDALRVRIDGDPQGRALRAIVNCAGMGMVGPVEMVPLDTWRQMFDVNLFGHIPMTQALLPALRRAKGRVVNISSTGGRIAMPAFGAYSATKFALEAMSDALRREIRHQGVDVVVVEPGAVRTGMGASGTHSARALIDTMSSEDKARYDGVMKGFFDTVAGFERHGISAERAAAQIADAVTTARPKTRYTIGRDAALYTRLARVLPDSALDRSLSPRG